MLNTLYIAETLLVLSEVLHSVIAQTVSLYTDTLHTLVLW